MAIGLLTESPLIPMSTIGPYRHADYLEPLDEPRCELIYGRFYLLPPPAQIHELAAGVLYQHLNATALAAGGLAVIHHSTVEPEVTYLSAERCESRGAGSRACLTWSSRLSLPSAIAERSFASTPSPSGLALEID
ncbi:MAG TPA: hypothetical protein VHQ90_26335 [Thermoanaerobaculia bacterium]|nr:hypothetical protein [Thermoanaerobaculia bacterium]